MKKISWLKRIFMSWDSLEKYFNNTEVSFQPNSVSEDLYKQTLETLEERKIRIEEYKVQLDEAKRLITKLETEASSASDQLVNERHQANELRTQINRIKVQLDERSNENNIIKNDIRDQLKTIGKIEKTFFASTGNKGKGELGERQVKMILETAGMSKDMWVENLQVGNTTVEFAIQSGSEGKYIPIDSKVLETDTDEYGKIIIDDKYRNKVKSQVAAVAKYLSKSNTTDYGILVLQSDSVYMKLFEEYRGFMEEMLRDFKINITSPSSFLQNAWSISHILDIYKKVHNDEKIYSDMASALESVSKFANSLSKVHKDFNIAMNSHYPALEKKHTILTKRLVKADKIKAIPKIEEK
ncbi:MAG: DNA recombination protein RmuC [Mycoplasmataceae bacterium]|nr:DNA recombination protein RmuC [Mycoplasmataceae bacterium]